jgi:hypothetical protein
MRLTQRGQRLLSTFLWLLWLATSIVLAGLVVEWWLPTP